MQAFITGSLTFEFRKKSTEEGVRPSSLRVDALQAAPSALAVSADRSGAASVHSFFGDDLEYEFDELLSTDSQALNAQDHVVTPADPRVSADALLAPSRNISPAVTIASSLSQDEADQWVTLDDVALREAEPPSSAEPILQDGAVLPLGATPSLNQDFVRRETEARDDGAASPHSDFDLLLYDDLTDTDDEGAEQQPLLHRTDNLGVDGQPTVQDAAPALGLGLGYDLQLSENDSQGKDDASVGEDEFHRDLLSRMQYHSSLQAQLAEREAALQKLEASTRSLAEAGALAKRRAFAIHETFHALKARPQHHSRVTHKFRSTLRSAGTKTKTAIHRAKENIQARIRRTALPLQASLKSNRNVESAPPSFKAPTPFLGENLRENLEAPVSTVSQPLQVEELRAELPLQISSPQERVLVSIENSPAPLPYFSTSLPLPVALTEIMAPSREITDPTHYNERFVSPEPLSAPKPSRTFNLNDFFIPFSLIIGSSQDGVVDAPYSTRAPQPHLSYGLSSSTRPSSSETNHVGGMKGATAITALTAASGSGAASLHEPHQKASSYSPHKDATHIQTLRTTPRYPTMRMPLPHRGNRRLFDSLVAVTA